MLRLFTGSKGTKETINAASREALRWFFSTETRGMLSWFFSTIPNLDQTAGATDSNGNAAEFAALCHALNKSMQNNTDISSYVFNRFRELAYCYVNIAEVKTRAKNKRLLPCDEEAIVAFFPLIADENKIKLKDGLTRINKKREDIDFGDHFAELCDELQEAIDNDDLIFQEQLNNFTHKCLVNVKFQEIIAAEKAAAEEAAAKRAAAKKAAAERAAAENIAVTNLDAVDADAIYDGAIFASAININAIDAATETDTSSPSLIEALFPLFAIELDTVVDGTTDKGDWLITFARLLEVFSDAWENNTNATGSGNGNPNSFFNKIVWNSDGSLTPIGWGCELLPFIGVGIGLVVVFYQKYHQDALNKYDYVIKTTQTLHPNANVDATTIQADFAKILGKKDFTTLLESDEVKKYKGGVVIAKSNKRNIRFKLKPASPPVASRSDSDSDMTKTDNESGDNSRNPSGDNLDGSGIQSLANSGEQGEPSFARQLIPSSSFVKKLNAREKIITDVARLLTMQYEENEKTITENFSEEAEEKEKEAEGKGKEKVDDEQVYVQQSAEEWEKTFNREIINLITKKSTSRYDNAYVDEETVRGTGDEAAQQASASLHRSARTTTILLSHPEENLEEQFKPNPHIQRLRDSELGNWMMALWLKSYFLAMLFWIPWWALVVLVGLGAINTVTLPFAAIALIPAAIYSVVKISGLIYFISGWIYNKLQKMFGKPKPPAEPNYDAEIVDKDFKDFKDFKNFTEPLALKLKIHYAIRVHHAAKRSLFAAALGKSELYLKEEHKQRKMAKLEKFQASKKAQEGKEDGTIYLTDTRIGQLILNVKGAKKRSMLNTFKNFLDGVVITFFIMWLFSTVVGAPLAIPLIPAAAAALFSPAATFLGGLAASTGFGVLSGLFLAVNAYTKEKNEQTKLQDNLLKKFQEPFTGFHRANSDLAKLTNESHYQMTKLEKWMELEHSIAKKKESILRLRKELHTLEKEFVTAKKTFAELIPDHVKKIVYDFNLDEIDPYNDYFFEKQKYQVPIFTRVKQGLTYMVHFLGGGQSGVFITRAFFLGSVTTSVALPTALVVGGTGLVVALAATGYGLPILLGVAIAFGLTYAIVRLGYNLYERRRRHNQLRADTVDERLSHMNKGESELKNTVDLLKESVLLMKAKLNADSAFDRGEVSVTHENVVANPVGATVALSAPIFTSSEPNRIPSSMKVSTSGLFAAKSAAQTTTMKGLSTQRPKWWRAKIEDKQQAPAKVSSR